MSEGRVVDDNTRRRQRLAADPGSSVWVSANAGAGKTKVLTDRVIRLMLAGSPPSRILCLTFTKAASAEMTGRVFGVLGGWVTLTDRELEKALQELTGEPAHEADLQLARRLFAQAVETPGGLKIETIHAFCERILHLAPFEAGVPARFVVLDEAEAGELLQRARDLVLTEAASGEANVAPLAAALDRVATEVSGDRLLKLIDDSVLHSRMPTDERAIVRAAARIARALGLEPGETADALRREATEGGIPPAEWPAVSAALEATGKPTDAERAAALRRALHAPNLEARWQHYEGIFFTEKGAPQSSVATKSVAAAVRERLEDEQSRIQAVRDRLLAAEALERTIALYRVAAAIRAKLEGLKRRLGALDFADLIERTLALLESGAAAWVLYKLDRGIDHVLIDEAQDTNEEQWRILKLLTEEFTAGAGRPVVAPRTVFAVGDPKQSIFSFQGADPRLFEQSRAHWRRKHDAAGLGFEHVSLDLSFRSAPAILEAVDGAFGVPAHFKGLSFDPSVTRTSHQSARTGAPGLVEIWPTELPDKSGPDPDAWSRAPEGPALGTPAAAVARRVAEAVRCWTSEPDRYTGRRWRPGDILILARKRAAAFFACIKELKAAGIPVAGADRIDVGEQIAVNDLVAAGQAALLPENDLVLAAALKSPLVGLDEDALFRIAADRPEGVSLATALERAARDDLWARQAWDVLRRWRGLAREHGPFGFYATLLGPMGGRRQLVERLGGEAADAIDTFLARAEAEEYGPDAPSLTTFLHRFETTSLEIRRDPEHGSGEVRVMTVHGAKGLEAPLVVVLDGCEQAPPAAALLPVQVGLHEADVLPVWSPRQGLDSRVLKDVRAQVCEREREEHARLLYVALTRAKDRLVVAPFTDMRGKEPPDAWFAMVRGGFAAAARALVGTELPYGFADIWTSGSPDLPASPEVIGEVLLSVPVWLSQDVPKGGEVARLRPSAAGGDARTHAPRAARARAIARRRGMLVHALVDTLAPLPTEARPSAGRRYLAARAASLPESDRERALADALLVLGHPDLAPLFGPAGRGEAAIAGRLGDPRRPVSGVIDRLAILPDEILLADFKTGSRPKDGAVPESYLTQLAIYRELLSEMHPDRPVRALLVWTTGPHVIELGQADLTRALRAALAPVP